MEIVFALCKALLRKSVVGGLCSHLLEHVVDHCGSLLMSGSYVTNRRLPFTENYGKLKNFPTVLLGVTQRIPWAKK